ncbi:YceI family protein [Bacterioplanoides sp.]|uniref:YceI family protein n=1 Tax=Bacterioplanoides sp. TaxID=2066072 RepID=UPI003AFF9B9B
MRLKRLILPLLILCSATHADWQLNNARSELSFVATKDARVADNHYFSRLSGSVTDTGEAELLIDTASVETNIAMRDRRLRDILFRITDFPQAKVTLSVRSGFLKPQPAGTVRYTDVNAKLFLVGATQLQKARLAIYYLADGAVEVSTIEPVLVDSEDFGLLPAVDQLREMAGLKSLTIKVPVSFRLVFEPV